MYGAIHIDHPLNAADLAVLHPDLDTARMVAPCEQVLDNALHLPSSGLILLEND